MKMSFYLSLNGYPIGLDSNDILSSSASKQPISLGQPITIVEAEINGVLKSYTNLNPGYILTFYINSAYQDETNYGYYKITGALEPILGSGLSEQNLIITASSDSNQQGLPIFNNSITITQMQVEEGNDLVSYPKISFNTYTPPPPPSNITSFNFSFNSTSNMVNINETYTYYLPGMNTPIPIQINYANISNSDQNGNTAEYLIKDISNTYEITGTGNVTGVQFPSSLIGKTGTVSGTSIFNTYINNLKFKNINNGTILPPTNLSITLIQPSSSALISRTAGSLSQTILSSHYAKS